MVLEAQLHCSSVTHDNIQPIPPERQPVNCLMHLISARTLTAQLVDTPLNLQVGQVECLHEHLFSTQGTETSESLCLQSFLRSSERDLLSTLRRADFILGLRYPS